jgi:uncharacterized delta-60 repeat protein
MLVVAVSRPRNVIALTLIAMLLCWSLPAQAAAGSLDPTFGIGGKVSTDFFGGEDFANAMAIQPDGKIIAGGHSFLFQGLSEFALARYNTDGSLDTAFGVSGEVKTAFPGQDGFITDIALQSDGKIVVVGTLEASNSFVSDFALARYDSDGSLDATFGAGGLVTTDFSGEDDRASAVAIQTDGKIVVAGLTTNTTTFLRDFALARYNTDGGLDSTFGIGGKIITDFSSQDNGGSDIALQPDGRIIVAGTTSTDGFSFDFALAQYNSDGSLDASFGAGGIVVTDITGDAEAGSLGLQTDGKIVAAGYSGTIPTDFALVRYNGDGSLDPTFGSGGVVTTDFSGNDDGISGLALQSDGKIVAAGTSLNPNTITSNFALARYASDGSLDPAFSSGGKIMTDFFGSVDNASDVAIQSDGSIVAAGNSDRESTLSDFALARYRSSGAPPDSCIVDDSNGSILMLSFATGEFQLTNCKTGFAVAGTGTITRKGCIITLQHSSTDLRVLAKIDTCTKKATASVQVFSLGRTFTITDRNTANNACGCL